MARFNGAIQVTKVAAAFELHSIGVSSQGKTVTLLGTLDGGPYTITLTPSESRAFMQVNQASGELRRVLQKAVKLAIEAHFAVATTVPPGGGVDDEFA